MNIVVLASMALILLDILRAAPYSTAFHLDFSWMPSIYVVSAFAALVLLVFLRRQMTGNRIIFWFSMYIAAVICFLLASSLETASIDQATYIFWFHLLTFTGFLISPMFLVFVLNYTERQELLYRPLTWLAIFGSTLFMIPLTNGSNILADPTKTMHHIFGYANTAPAGPGNLGAVLFSSVILLTGMLSLILYYAQVKAKASQRKQVRLFIIATTVPIAFGFVITAILPYFKINLPLDPLLIFIQTAIIGYAILRYKLFSIDPTALADTILETVSESVVTINTKKEIVYLNQASRQLLQLQSKNIYGHGLNAIFDKQTAHTIAYDLKQHVLADSVELMISVGEQSIKTPISLTASRIICRGALEGYLLVFRDISKELAIKRDIEQLIVARTKELDSEHARLEAAMDSLSVGLLMTFKDRQTISYNAILPEVLLGDTQPHGQLHAVTLDSLDKKLRTSDFNLTHAIDDCQLTGKPFDIKEVAYNSQILHIFGAPISLHSGGAIGAIVLVENVTEAKILERSKDEFFSIASHELRTPLTSIKGNTAMIKQYYPEVLKDKGLREMIDDIHSSSVRLIAVVNDFLDVSRLEESKISFDYEAVNLQKVMESVAYEMQAVLKEKKLYLKLDDVTLDDLPLVWADKNRLQQVIYNLLGNASKFTEQGGITLSAKVDGGFVKVLVSDTGRGMTKASQLLLFHKFQQASSSLLTRDTTRGTGLGLYISKMIVENMGGQVKLEESIEDKGTVFSFTVPIMTPEHRTTIADTIAATDTRTGLSMPKQLSTSHAATTQHS